MSPTWSVESFLFLEDFSQDDFYFNFCVNVFFLMSCSSSKDVIKDVERVEHDTARKVFPDQSSLLRIKLRWSLSRFGPAWNIFSYFCHCHVMCKSQIWLRKKISCRIFFLRFILLFQNPKALLSSAYFSHLQLYERWSFFFSWLLIAFNWMMYRLLPITICGNFSISSN